ncbi:MAG TPA: TRAP transporter substrate-binding protein [Acetobacteraceae bacterium]|nr:TRAP transporter substrate-binding protein [Acetobacteraceae bacterium]
MKTTRRAMTLGGAAALALGSRRARADAEFSYKIGTSTPAAHPFNKRLQEVGDRIASDSKGRMELHVFPDSQLGGDNDLLSQARSGAIEFCQPTGQILSSILPVTAVSAMGFIFADYSKVWPAMDGDLGRLVRTQITAKAGLVPMERMWDLGFRQITTSNRPVRNAADLEGLKLRTPIAPSLISLFQALKAAPVGMQYGEVYSALQTHIVDGQENPLSQVEAGKFYEVQKYCSMTNHVWDGYWICCNPDAWHALPPDLQAIVARNFNDVAIDQRVDIAKLNASTRSLLVAKGMVFNDTDPDSFRAQLRAAKFYAEWHGKLGNEAWTLLEKYVGKIG